MICDRFFFCAIKPSGGCHACMSKHLTGNGQICFESCPLIMAAREEYSPPDRFRQMRQI